MTGILKQWIVFPALWLGAPPGLTMSNSFARLNPNSCLQRLTDVNQKGKKKNNNKTTH